jgi:hypothetical protein
VVDAFRDVGQRAVDVEDYDFLFHGRPVPLVIKV